MKLIQTQPVDIAIRSLHEEDQRRIAVWFDRLRNWKKDSFVREHSKKLRSGENVHVLTTTDDFLIFYRPEKDQVEVLDIAKASRIAPLFQGAGR